MGRRQAMHIGFCSALGLGMGDFFRLQAETTLENPLLSGHKAKSVIHLHLPQRMTTAIRRVGSAQRPEVECRAARSDRPRHLTRRCARMRQRQHSRRLARTGHGHRRRVACVPRAREWMDLPLQTQRSRKAPVGIATEHDKSVLGGKGLLLGQGAAPEALCPDAPVKDSIGPRHGVGAEDNAQQNQAGLCTHNRFIECPPPDGRKRALC